MTSKIRLFTVFAGIAALSTIVVSSLRQQLTTLPASSEAEVPEAAVEPRPGASKTTEKPSEPVTEPRGHQIQVHQQARTSPSWAVRYGREFWRKESAERAQPATGSQGVALPSNLDLGEIVSRVSHAFRQNDPSLLPQVNAANYIATLDGGGFRLSPKLYVGEEKSPDLRWSNPFWDSGSQAVRTSPVFVEDPSTEATFRTDAIRQDGDTLYTRGAEPVPWSVLGNTAQGLLNGQLGLIEHYETDAAGVEVTWLLQQKPGGSGPLEIDARLDGLTYSGEDAEGHHFADGTGQRRIKVGQVEVVDANGKRTEIPLLVEDSTLKIRLPSSLLNDATYPLAIDPPVGPEIVVPSSTIQFSPAVGSYGGNYLVAWMDGGSANLRGTRVSFNGDLIDASGFDISAATGGQAYPDIVGKLAPSPAIGNYLNRMEAPGANIGDPVTTTILNNSASGSGGTWSLWTTTFIDHDQAPTEEVETSLSSMSLFTVSQDYETPALGLATSGPVGAGDGGKRTFAYYDNNPVTIRALDWSTSDPNDTTLVSVHKRQLARFVFSQGTSKVSIGCFLTLNNFSGSTYGSYDLITLEGGGEFAVLNFQDFPIAQSLFYMQMHTQAGTGYSNGGGYVQVEPNTTYWVTMLWDTDTSDGTATRTAKLEIYDPATWELLGTSSLGLSSATCAQLTIGRNDTHGGANADAHHIYDDLIIDLTGSQFPLLPAEANDGPNYFVAWMDYRSSPYPDIYGARVKSRGAAGSALVVDSVTTGIKISDYPNGQSGPKVTSSGADYFVVWSDDRTSGNGRDVYGARVRSSDGVVLDPDGIAISALSGDYSTQSNPDVEFNGTHYMVVWYDTRNSTTYSDIYGARVNTSGTVVDTSGFAVFVGTTRQGVPAIARAGNGTDCLVVWNDGSSPFQIWGTRLDASGTPLDPSGIVINSAPSGNPVIAAKADGYLVAWHMVSTTSGDGLDISGAFVSSSGTPSSAFLIGSGMGDQTPPWVACNGTTYLVSYLSTYYSPRKVCLRLVTP